MFTYVFYINDVMLCQPKNPLLSYISACNIYKCYDTLTAQESTFILYKRLIVMRHAFKYIG